MPEHTPAECMNTPCVNRREALIDQKSELIDANLLLQQLQRYAAKYMVADDGAPDPHMAAVYATISKYNLGTDYKTGGPADDYLIPEEI